MFAYATSVKLAGVPRQLRQCLMNDRKLFERFFGFTVCLEVLLCVFVGIQKYYGKISLQFTGILNCSR